MMAGNYETWRIAAAGGDFSHIPLARKRDTNARIEVIEDYSERPNSSRPRRSDDRPMKILIAIDGSDSSKAALESVIARPWPPHTQVNVLHVVEPPSLLMGREMGGIDPEFEMVWNALREQAKDLVAKAADKLRAAKFNASSQLVEGDPKSQIIDIANEWGADMIVLGSHGHKGLSRFLIGSVSQDVVRHAHCSVEIIRTKA